MMLRDFEGFLPDGVLTKLDRAAMHRSLEARCPFLDVEMIQLAWRIPLSLRVNENQSKQPLRRLLNRRVPEALINRPKSGFTPPIDNWIRGTLRDWAEQLLSPERLANQSGFDPVVVQRLWRQHRSGEADHGRNLWPVLMLIAWREHWHL